MKGIGAWIIGIILLNLQLPIMGYTFTFANKTKPAKDVLVALKFKLAYKPEQVLVPANSSYTYERATSCLEDVYPRIPDDPRPIIVLPENSNLPTCDDATIEIVGNPADRITFNVKK